MTKPANFPEKKRQRRLSALGRIIGTAHAKTPAGAVQIAALEERTAENLRHIRTKKYRGSGREYQRTTHA